MQHSRILTSLLILSMFASTASHASSTRQSIDIPTTPAAPAAAPVLNMPTPAAANTRTGNNAQQQQQRPTNINLDTYLNNARAEFQRLDTDRNGILNDRDRPAAQSGPLQINIPTPAALPVVNAPPPPIPPEVLQSMQPKP